MDSLEEDDRKMDKMLSELLGIYYADRDIEEKYGNEQEQRDQIWDQVVTIEVSDNSTDIEDADLGIDSLEQPSKEDSMLLDNSSEINQLLNET